MKFVNVLSFFFFNYKLTSVARREEAIKSPAEITLILSLRLETAISTAALRSAADAIAGVMEYATLDNGNPLVFSVTILPTPQGIFAPII